MIVLLFISDGSTVFAAEQKYKLSVPEITWPGSAEGASSALYEQKGVIKVDTDPKLQTATITFNGDDVSLEKIKKAFEKSGYTVKKAQVIKW